MHFFLQKHAEISYIKDDIWICWVKRLNRSTFTRLRLRSFRTVKLCFALRYHTEGEKKNMTC